MMNARSVAEMMEMIEQEMSEAVNACYRFHSAYDMWFTLFGDPHSDDIVSDIHHQAETWAWEQVRKLEAVHV